MIPAPVTIIYRGYTLTTDKAKMFPEAVHEWISTASYWAEGMPYALFQQAFEQSYCIGVLKDNEQVGFARLITDYSTFGYLADVYIKEEHRKQGLSKELMALIMQQDWVNGLRRIMLATRDAHELYRQYGFAESNNPDRLMEIVKPNIYRQDNQDC